MTSEPTAQPPGEAPARAPKSTARNTLIVMAGTLGSRLSGIVRQQLIVSFGSTLSDAFLLASRVPNLLRELLAEGALVNSFIPVYKSLGTEERRALARSFSGALIAINLLLTAIGILAAPWIVDLLLSNHPNVDVALTVYMVRLVMPFLMLISLASIAMGLLNADEHFRESSFAPIAFNLASIVVLLLLPKTATWLALGWLVGGLAQLVVQLPALMRFGLLPTPTLEGHPALGRVLRQMAPFMLTTGARQFLNIYVARLLSNGQLFQSGTTTGYGNAETMFTMANGLLVVSPALALFPRFSQLAADRQWDAFRTLTVQALRTVTFLSAPASALMVVLAPYLIRIFDLNGRMSSTTFAAGSGILNGWALALLPWAINTILLRTFYARERTRDAVMVSAVGFVVEVALYSLLTPHLKFLGFGVSTTISGVLMAIALMVLYGRFPLGALLVHLARVVPLALVAGMVTWALTRVLPAPTGLLPSLVTLAVAGAAGLGTYLALAVALRVPEVNGVLRRLRR
ncbi:murein biosynthesis integral membrane protein MurJ [Deinococcus maricopensis]|uniref:Probable lipid II flippase MurJ n=1 Tax=Deinococcus maricopensis (strain DSM 21211 / LMG 22137 / NRRL B-23946 / LB-34) TaxID=709986 RepID=E8UB95_DEIML|nr:murein biosynthesis integral membrane protein MurJ [Deinococcus maricopensis]ADV68334.1 integral membrane protein MviN [Deinococcus maricopensis DSM 21211]